MRSSSVEESRHALKIANDESDVADRFDSHADSNYTVRLPFSIYALSGYLQARPQYKYVQRRRGLGTTKPSQGYKITDILLGQDFSSYFGFAIALHLPDVVDANHIAIGIDIDVAAGSLVVDVFACLEQR
jgi:hypothetical protein